MWAHGRLGKHYSNLFMPCFCNIYWKHVVFIYAIYSQKYPLDWPDRPLLFTYAHSLMPIVLLGCDYATFTHVLDFWYISWQNSSYIHLSAMGLCFTYIGQDSWCTPRGSLFILHLYALHCFSSLTWMAMGTSPICSHYIFALLSGIRHGVSPIYVSSALTLLPLHRVSFWVQSHVR